MIATILAIKEQLLAFYAKKTIYIDHIVLFLLAFFTFYMYGNMIGFNGLLSNILICLAAALVCAFLPVNATVLTSTLFLILHLFSLSLELTGIALAVLIVLYLLYFRFTPKTGVLLIITPLMFYFHIPYIVPVIAALSFGISGIIPVMGGVFLYGLIDFASQYSTAIVTLDADNALQTIMFIFNSVLLNNKLIVLSVSFALIIMMIYLIKRLSVNYAWIIAIVSGCITDSIILLVSFTVLAVEFNVVEVVLGHILAIIIGLIMNLFLFSLDYSSTEYVQFEDNDYYYFVKAVPKMSVTTKDFKIKTITSQIVNKGNTHTESFEETEEE